MQRLPIGKKTGKQCKNGAQVIDMRRDGLGDCLEAQFIGGADIGGRGRAGHAPRPYRLKSLIPDLLAWAMPKLSFTAAAADTGPNYPAAQDCAKPGLIHNPSQHNDNR